MIKYLFLALWLVLLAACSSTQPKNPTRIDSTHTEDSAPLTRRDVALIADATPRPVVRTRAGNKSPYTVLGKTYTLLSDSSGYQQKGNASWYGTKFHGRRTANGEVYDMWAMTAAHKTLPIPSYVRVTHLKNGRSVVVRVNDRGPFHDERIIDLSYAAATKLGFAKQGVAQVEVVDITPVHNAPVISAPTTTEVVVENSQQQPVAKEPAQAVTLQVAAFRDKARAVALQAKLSALLSAPVAVVANKESTWYRVRIGPIIGQSAMSEARQILAEQGLPNARVVDPT